MQPTFEQQHLAKLWAETMARVDSVLDIEGHAERSAAISREIAAFAHKAIEQRVAEALSAGCHYAATKNLQADLVAEVDRELEHQLTAVADWKRDHLRARQYFREHVPWRILHPRFVNTEYSAVMERYLISISRDPFEDLRRRVQG